MVLDLIGVATQLLLRLDTETVLNDMSRVILSHSLITLITIFLKNCF